MAWIAEILLVIPSVAREVSLAKSFPASPARADLFEAFVAGELRRGLGWSEHPAALFRFRTRDRVEVDIVIEDDDRNVAGIEVKASSTVDASDFKGLRFLQDRVDPVQGSAQPFVQLSTTLSAAPRCRACAEGEPPAAHARELRSR